MCSIFKHACVFTLRSAAVAPTTVRHDVYHILAASLVVAADEQDTLSPAPT